MKKFSEIDSKLENKKYQKKSENDIYSMIKESINVNIEPLNNNISANLDNVKINLDGFIELVEKLDNYLNNKIIQEKIKTLQSIKASIATGTLSIQKINEEIESSCKCSETCPTPNNTDDTDDTNTSDDTKKGFNDDDYDDNLDIVEKDSEYITID